MYGEDDFLPGPSRARRNRRHHTIGSDEVPTPDEDERVQYNDVDEEDVGSATSVSGSENG